MAGACRGRNEAGRDEVTEVDRGFGGLGEAGVSSGLQKAPGVSYMLGSGIMRFIF